MAKPTRKKRPIRRGSDRAPKKRSQLISKSDAARLKGVSKSAISHATEPGGPLYDALVGSKIDTGSAAFDVWMAAGPGGASEELRQLIIRKRRVEVERLEARVAKDEGRIITREYVATRVVGFLEQLSDRLQGDIPRALASDVLGLALAGATREQIERLISERNLQALRFASQSCERSLAEAPAAGDNPLPVPATRRHESPARAVTDKARAEILLAAPKIVMVGVKAVARAAPDFDAFMAEHRGNFDDAIRCGTVILTAHIDEASTAEM
jgi:hypothetical protein